MVTTFDNRAVVNRKAPGKRPELFPTPPWAPRALISEVLLPLGVLRREPSSNHIVEPACGLGHLVHALEDYGRVTYSDVYPWQMLGRHGGETAPELDFVWSGSRERTDYTGIHGHDKADLALTNPPFTLAAEFWRLLWHGGLASNVALLVRTNWVEGMGRYRDIFSHSPPNFIVHSADRIPMIEGVWDPEASTATAYSWFVWTQGERRPDIWLPPGMARKYSRQSDMALAVPGEAKRRLAAKKAAQSEAGGQIA